MRSRLTKSMPAGPIRSRILLTALLALAAAPGSAVAATVETGPEGILYRAVPGEVNDVTMRDGNAFPPRRTVNEISAPLILGLGCDAGPPILCGEAPAVEDVIRLGNRDDRADYYSNVADSAVYGGRGDDYVYSGGLLASGYGGAGDDSVTTNDNTGGETLGGPGDDLLRHVGVFTVMRGGTGDDHLREERASAPVDMAGGPGNDLLEIEQVRGGRARGGAGDDSVTVHEPTSGPFTLLGGPGNDLITGSTRTDEIYGGPGRDHLVAAERTADSPTDTLNCGPGYDRVTVDPQDVVAADCEHVEVLAPFAAPASP